VWATLLTAAAWGFGPGWPSLDQAWTKQAFERVADALGVSPTGLLASGCRPIRSNWGACTSLHRTAATAAAAAPLLCMMNWGLVLSIKSSLSR